MIIKRVALSSTVSMSLAWCMLVYEEISAISL